MYELKDKDGNIRSMTILSSYNKVCNICGQYFKKCDKYTVIVIPTKYRCVPKLKSNWLVHTHEWLNFIEGIETEEEQFSKMSKHKKPHKKEFTEDEKLKLEAFKKSCFNFGFRKVFEKPYGIKCQQSGSSLYAEFNVYTGHIDIDFKGKHGLFDAFYIGDMKSKIYNSMNEILGLPKVEEYSAREEISKVVEEVNKMMK